ncbi:hypothetical protein BDV96DRAFT_687557 [Lophiotrema nucula]|uniref:Uncharacterized protein n=1 Tax=Lophiotrema nucula TaxID=690887 RepID=A0A6A5Z8Q0_9PLEO|nr:hypothetical protein BDV96DRAFT_687557 [Lophiotrema nucula]
MDQSFRFLDLPKEIRLIIYENIPVTETQFNVFLPGNPRTHGNPGVRYLSGVLINFAIPVTILATCRLIFAEAKPIVLSKSTIAQLKPKLLVDFAHPELLCSLRTCLEPHCEGVALFGPEPFRLRRDIFRSYIWSLYCWEKRPRTCELRGEEAAFIGFAERVLRYWNHMKKSAVNQNRLRWDVPFERELELGYEVVYLKEGKPPEPVEWFELETFKDDLICEDIELNGS